MVKENNKKMKLLIGASSSKIFHLQEFSNYLKKIDVECKLVFDADYADGFPSRSTKSWFNSNKKFKNLLDEFRPDAIFVDRQRHFGLEAAKTDIPLLVHLRGNYWAEMNTAKETLYKSFPKNIAINKWEEIGSKCFENSKVILPICKYLENIVKEHYPRKPTSVLYQGIEPENWYPTNGMKLKHPCVGLVQSAVIWGKTHEMLMLKIVLESMPKIHFYWAGDGPYRDKILAELEKFDNFHWLGNLEYPGKVRDFLTEIDIYALISGIDMSPLTLLEAQLMEKPVIATNVGGIPELIEDGKNGFLIEKGDYQELINKINLILNDPALGKLLGKTGKDYVSNNFHWKKIADDFIKILKNIKIGF
jgi:glycosyltransferase involved in cell wall biosynthesis